MQSEPFIRVTLFLLRVVVGLMFVEHGTQKLLGWPPPAGQGMGPVPLASLLGAAACIEIAGGFLVVLGLLTRPAAFLMSGEMAVAYFIQHFPRGFWPIVNHGELAVLYCFIFMFFSAAGAGVYSFDQLISGRREPQEVLQSSAPNPFRPWRGLLGRRRPQGR